MRALLDYSIALTVWLQTSKLDEYVENILLLGAVCFLIITWFVYSSYKR